MTGLRRLVERRLGRPVRFHSAAIADELATRHRMPLVFLEFLRCGSSDDFGDGLCVARLDCALTNAAGFELLHLTYASQDGWPAAWIVCAAESEGCFFLDTAHPTGDDCPVLHLSHGDGLRARPIAASFVAFLERIVSESPRQPEIPTDLLEAGYELSTDPDHLDAVARLATRWSLPGAYVDFLRHWMGEPGAQLVALEQLDALQESVRQRFPDWRPEWFAIAIAEHTAVHFLWLGTRHDDDAQVWSLIEGASAPLFIDRSFATYVLEPPETLAQSPP
jgi:hypothetical protein